VSAEWPFE